MQFVTQAANTAGQAPVDDSARALCAAGTNLKGQISTANQQYAGHLLLLDIDSSCSGTLHSPSPPASPAPRGTHCGGSDAEPMTSNMQLQPSTSPLQQQLQEQQDVDASAAQARGTGAANFTPPSNYVERADRTVSTLPCTSRGKHSVHSCQHNLTGRAAAGWQSNHMFCSGLLLWW